MLPYPHTQKSANLSSYLDSSQGNIFYQEAGAGGGVGGAARIQSALWKMVTIRRLGRLPVARAQI